jgi:hypothetical protein
VHWHLQEHLIVVDDTHDHHEHDEIHEKEACEGYVLHDKQFGNKTPTFSLPTLCRVDHASVTPLYARSIALQPTIDARAPPFILL